MIIKEEILVDAPIATVWSLIDRLESVIPCVPGASYEGQQGDETIVAVRVRIGVISASFKGQMRFAEKDHDRHRAVIEGAGRDTGGKGSAKASIVGELEEVGPQKTLMRATVDLSMTGRIAQFGGPIIVDVAKQIVQQFGRNLQERVLNGGDVAPPPQQPAAVGQTGNAAPAAAAELDLGAIAFRRFKPLVLGVVAASVLAAAAYFLM